MESSLSFDECLDFECDKVNANITSPEKKSSESVPEKKLPHEISHCSTSEPSTKKNEGYVLPYVEQLQLNMMGPEETLLKNESKINVRRLKRICHHAQIERFTVSRNRDKFLQSSNEKLKLRIEEISLWGGHLQRCYSDLLDLEEKFVNSMEKMNYNVVIIINLKESVSKALSLRQDNFDHEAFEELNNEINLLERCEDSFKKILKDITRMYWELKAESEFILRDLKDKALAISIDKSQLQLNTTASSSSTVPENEQFNISFPMITLEKWIYNATIRKSRADLIIKNSNSLLHDVSNTIQNFKTDISEIHQEVLVSLQEDDDYLCEEERTIMSLKKELSLVIQDLQLEYRNLTQSMKNSKSNLSTVSTRMKNREKRPRTEDVIDAAYLALKSEHDGVQHDTAILMRNINKIKCSITEACTLEESYEKKLSGIKRRIQLNEEIAKFINCCHFRPTDLKIM